MVEELHLYLTIGGNEIEFWSLTPRQTRLRCEVAIELEVQEYKKLLWQAWHTAAYSRVKRLPDLKRELRRLDRINPEGKKPEQIKEVVMSLHSLFGGKELRKGRKNNLNKKRKKPSV